MQMQMQMPKVQTAVVVVGSRGLQFAVWLDFDHTGPVSYIFEFALCIYICIMHITYVYYILHIVMYHYYHNTCG